MLRRPLDGPRGETIYQNETATNQDARFQSTGKSVSTSRCRCPFLLQKAVVGLAAWRHLRRSLLKWALAGRSQHGPDAAAPADSTSRRFWRRLATTVSQGEPNTRGRQGGKLELQCLNGRAAMVHDPLATAKLIFRSTSAAIWVRISAPEPRSRQKKRSLFHTEINEVS